MNEKKTTQLARKWIKEKPMPSSLENEFKSSGLAYLLDCVYRRTAELIKENMDATQAETEHLKQILPCIAFYETILHKEGNKDEALMLFEKWCFKKIESMAKIIPRLLRIPGLYKTIPSFMKKMLRTKFGPAAGFEFIEKECEKGFAADMIKCPYVEACKKYNCPELAQFFCKADDLCYGNMHPKLIWDRKKTLGTGGDCCDFKLYIRQ